MNARDDERLCVTLSRKYNADMKADLKDEAKRLIDNPPRLTSWDELMYEIYVRQTTEAGLADSDAGRTAAVEAVRERFNLPN